LAAQVSSAAVAVPKRLASPVVSGDGAPVVSRSVPVSLRIIADDLLTWTGLAPLVASVPLPTGPVDPVVQTLWLGVRRSVQQAQTWAHSGSAASAESIRDWLMTQAQTVLVNQDPIAVPDQILQSSVSGAVVGGLGLSDPNGDLLRYVVSRQPGRGTVVLSPDGQWVYMPAADLLADGGQDTFEVAVSDRGWHLVGDDHAVVTVPVTVTVLPMTLPTPSQAQGPATNPKPSEPTSNEPVVTAPRKSLLDCLFGAVSAALVDVAPVAAVRQLVELPFTGVDASGTPVAFAYVYGTVDATDGNGDRLTYAVSQQASRGQIILGEDGLYSYVVTDPDLLAHGGQDSFTVAVTDHGWHPFGDDAPDTVDVPATLDITPVDPATADDPAQAPNLTEYALEGGGPPPRPDDIFRKITVTNKTWLPIRYNGVVWGDEIYGPRYGDILEPGKTVEMLKIYWFWGGEQTRATFRYMPQFGDGADYLLDWYISPAFSYQEVRCLANGRYCTPDYWTRAHLDNVVHVDLYSRSAVTIGG
jgi:hypothetical protein